MTASTPAPPETPWSALILAGGRSQRMGRDKALLDWQGQPLLSALRQRLQRLGAGTVLVSGDRPQHQGIADRHPGQGPLGGLASSLALMADGDWLVLPVDLPRLGRELVEALREQRGRARCFTHHPLPLWLQLDAQSRSIIAACSQASGAERSVKALHAALNGSQIVPSATVRFQLFNCNTPDDWQEAKRT